jgi:uncharacterized protein
LEYCSLGNTGIVVSRLCFGTLTISPLQRRYSKTQGTDLLRAAVDLGVNFFDTAEIYQAYDLLKPVIKSHNGIIVATKCYAFNAATAEKSYQKAVKELGREWIDIFMLHEQESQYTLKGHEEALEYFLKLKEKGYIGALGISTHHIQGVKAACMHTHIDVVEAILNHKGWGIIDGSLDEMERSLQTADRTGMGIIAMKPLGGGHLIKERDEAFRFIRNKCYIDSVALGIQSIKELKYAIAYLTRKEDTLDANDFPDITGREVIVEPWCTGCGKCLKVCQHGAIRLMGNKALIDKDKCVSCGYCGASCPELSIKVI